MSKFLDMKYIFTVVAAAFCCQLALAQDSLKLSPIKADRPDQTETPYIVPARMFQIETGFQFEKGRNGDTGFLLPTILAKYGVNKNLELRLVAESAVDNAGGVRTSGVKQIVVGFKANLAMENGISPQTSFRGHLGLPNFASTPYKTDYFAPAFSFLMEHTLSDKISLSYNLGAEWDGFSSEPTFVYTLATGFSLTEKLGLFTEVYGFAPQKSKADHRADAGLTYLITDNFMLDTSGGFSITNNSPNYFVSAGFSFRI